jgi:putative Mg2+ transporter-C (MgtC) family protein
MIFQILFSIILGMFIGMEREQCGKAVGYRTVSLITLGSTLFTLMSPQIFGGDNSRIIAQIVSGMGFLGAGVIFKNGDNISGLTTAATLWVAAAIGCLVGIGCNKEALIGTLLILVINHFHFFKNNEH